MVWKPSTDLAGLKSKCQCTVFFAWRQPTFLDCRPLSFIFKVSSGSSGPLKVNIERVSYSGVFDSLWPHGLQAASLLHGILQARMLEWVAIPFSRGSSWPRDQIQVSCIAGRFLTIWATREAPHTVFFSWRQPTFLHCWHLSFVFKVSNGSSGPLQAPSFLWFFLTTARKSILLLKINVTRWVSLNLSEISFDFQSHYWS